MFGSHAPDDSWSFYERPSPEGDGAELCLIGHKGPVFSYVNETPLHPGFAYSREEAVLNASLAAGAIPMLRCLEELERSMADRAFGDPEVRAWRDQALRAIAVA